MSGAPAVLSGGHLEVLPRDDTDQEEEQRPAALATPRTINKIGFCGFVQPPNSVTLLATLRPSLLLNTLMLTNHYTLYMQISTSGLLSQS